MKKSLIKLFAVVSLFSLSILSLAPLPTYAANETTSADVCGSDVPDSVKQAAGCSNVSSNENDLATVITNILNAVIAVSGLVAVVFIIVGGINYMTSAGETQKLEKSKKTILYAVIGLAVCALSFAIVNWAINVIY